MTTTSTNENSSVLNPSFLKVEPATLTDILSKWNYLLSSKKKNLSVGQDADPDHEVVSTIEQWIKENVLFRIGLLERLTDFSNEKDKCQFIQIHQVLVIKILDRIYSLGKEEVNPEARSVFNALTNHLQETLDFMEEFVPKYFDRNEKMPIPYFLASKDLLNKSSEFLGRAISGNELIDEKLGSLVLKVFESFISEKRVTPTYLDLEYLNDLLHEISPNVDAMDTQALRSKLYYLNFNTASFIDYEFERLVQLVINLESPKQKIAVLKHEQKKINQWSTKLNYAYSNLMPSLKDQVNSWINEEVRFLEGGHSQYASGDTLQSTDKIHTTLSVAKLALIIRLLVVDKIIVNRAVAPMLKIVAKMFTTLQKDDISFTSLEAKYHAPDKATITTVRDMLFKWINILDRL